MMFMFSPILFLGCFKLVVILKIKYEKLLKNLSIYSHFGSPEDSMGFRYEKRWGKMFTSRCPCLRVQFYLFSEILASHSLLIYIFPLFFPLCR